MTWQLKSEQGIENMSSFKDKKFPGKVKRSAQAYSITCTFSQSKCGNLHGGTMPNTTEHQLAKRAEGKEQTKELQLERTSRGTSQERDCVRFSFKI